MEILKIMLFYIDIMRIAENEEKELNTNRQQENEIYFQFNNKMKDNKK